MATREIVELPDKHTGDINEIRDKKIALASEASGATDITAQCEYLIKNGQTGEFMNVLKSYIDESVRSALGALVNNLDKGSSIKSVLATDSSNDLGSITPANLASVLGGVLRGVSLFPWKGIVASMDNIKWNGDGMGKVTAGPDGKGGFFINFNDGLQVVFSWTNKIHIRSASSGSWDSWRTI